MDFQKSMSFSIVRGEGKTPSPTVYSIVELWEQGATHHGEYSLEMADAKIRQLQKKNPDSVVLMTQEKKKG